MWAGINKDRLKVFGEFWSFLLAVLDYVIGQIQKCQLPVTFSYETQLNGKNGGKDIRMQSISFFDHAYTVHFQEINFAY